MMKLPRSLAPLLISGGVLALVVIGLLNMSACGDINDDVDLAANIPFTPVPTFPPPMLECGDGALDEGEECDNANGGPGCTGGETCVCCLCLTPEEELGDRTFSVARAGNGPSQFFSSALNYADVATAGIAWIIQPITLRAGRPNPDEVPGLGAGSKCLADLTVAEDAILGFRNPIGTVCNKFFAAGSSGAVDVDGATPQDVTWTQNSNGANEEDPPQILTGQGTVAGPCSATLQFARAVIVNVPLPVGSPGNSPAYDCTTVDYDNPLSTPGVTPSDVIDGPLALTTANASGTLMNVRQGGPDIVTPVIPSNRPFVCSAWTQEDGPGGFVGPVAGLDTIIGDTLNFFLLIDTP